MNIALQKQSQLNTKTTELKTVSSSLIEVGDSVFDTLDRANIKVSDHEKEMMDCRVCKGYLATCSWFRFAITFSPSRVRYKSSDVTNSVFNNRFITYSFIAAAIYSDTGWDFISFGRQTSRKEQAWQDFVGFTFGVYPRSSSICISFSLSFTS